MRQPKVLDGLPGARRALVDLYLDDLQTGTVVIPRTLDSSFASVGVMVGANAGTSVTPAYESPFPFTGTIDRIVYEFPR